MDSRSSSTSSDGSDSDGEGLSLSAATLAALRAFSIESGLDLPPPPSASATSTSGNGVDSASSGGNVDTMSLLSTIAQHFDTTPKEEVFTFDFHPSNRIGSSSSSSSSTSSDSSSSSSSSSSGVAASVLPPISFSVKGVARHRGQTLNSTGLTIWRAAEHLCNYLYDHPEVVSNKTVCELGAGLGIVSILADKVGTARRVVCTDGDDEALEAFRSNIPSLALSGSFSLDKLYWGQNEAFVHKYPDRFDVVLAADVIYEPEQVEPLIATVKEIMKEDGCFVLAFARRNVKMDDVLTVAAAAGLEHVILDRGISDMEPIYYFTSAAKAGASASGSSAPATEVK